MAGRRKYTVLLLVTACITAFIIFYVVFSNSSNQKEPDEKINNPPIVQKTEQQKFKAPDEDMQLLPDPLEQSVPDPAPQPPPQPVTPPAPKPAPKPVPKPTPKTANNVAIPKGSIGAYKTRLLDKDYGRTKNINLAAKKINGYMLEPGSSFSFNEIVGERSFQNGYESAKVIIDGEFSEGIGGGICQLSSTLYNAAKKAGLKILERHKHSRKVSYVEEGQDAAVDYGTLDLKFKNTTGCPVEVRAGVKNGEVYAFIIKMKQKIPVSP